MGEFIRKIIMAVMVAVAQQLGKFMAEYILRHRARAIR